jgi:hypothetical protein
MFLDFIGLFILISGFVVGLGAVIVIDIHGFLGQKSSYWTEATIRTHKITKPLIWVGISLAVVGGFIFFRNNYFSGVPIYLGIIACVLIINGIFLSFHVSPYLLQKEKEGRASEILPSSWQRKIIISLIFSDLGWWGGLLIFLYYLVFNS